MRSYPRERGFPGRPADGVLYGNCRLSPGRAEAEGTAYCFSGYHGWQGTDRFISYAESPLDEIIFDPLLPRATEPRQPERELIEAVGKRDRLQLQDVLIGSVDENGYRACTALQSNDQELYVDGPELDVVIGIYSDLRVFWAWSDTLPGHLLLFEQTGSSIIAAVKTTMMRKA